MKLFKKIAQPSMDGESKNNWTNKAAGKIAGTGIWLQTKFAEVMNKIISGIPHQKLKTILIIFCLLSGGFSIYLATHAIFGTDKQQPLIEVKQTAVPRHFNKTGSEINEPDNFISEKMYQEIQEYKSYMDSLGKTIRPGLSDSIHVLEQNYHSQKQK